MYKRQVNSIGECEMVPSIVGAPRLTFDHDLQVLEIHDDELGDSVKVCSEDLIEFINAVIMIQGHPIGTN